MSQSTSSRRHLVGGVGHEGGRDVTKVLEDMKNVVDITKMIDKTKVFNEVKYPIISPFLFLTVLLDFLKRTLS